MFGSELFVATTMLYDASGQLRSSQGSMHFPDVHEDGEERLLVDSLWPAELLCYWSTVGAKQVLRAIKINNNRQIQIAIGLLLI